MSTNNNNNSAETMVKRSTFQERGLVGEDNYPDPNTLPLPSQEPRISDVTLSELTPGKYVYIDEVATASEGTEKSLDAIGGATHKFYRLPSFILG
jgi:hypothetical protein